MEDMEEYWLWRRGWCLRNKNLCLLLDLIMTIIIVIALLVSYWSISPMFFYPLLAFSVSYLFMILAVGRGFFGMRASLRIYRVSTGIMFASVSAISFGVLHLILANGDAHLILYPPVTFIFVIGLIFLLIGIHRIYSGIKG